MINMKKSIILLFFVLCSLGASAQTTLQTAYFMDRMPTRHKLNPALINEYGYFAIPAVGDVSISLNSNLALDNFLYPIESGGLGTFLHPEVDSSAFLSGLNDNNIISENLNLTLFSMGFHGFGGYNTIDLSLRENFNVNLKKSFFEFLVGSESGSSIYDLSGSSISLNTWAELSVGHAHRINENLTVGVKLKYLSGLANVNTEITKLDFESSNERLLLDFEASGDAAVVGLPLSGSLSEMELDGLDFSNGLNSGFAIDLGATYEWEKFNFSLAVTDLGYINWATASNITMGSTINFEGFSSLDINDFEASTEEELDEIYDSLESLSDPSFEAKDAYKTYLSAKLVAGAEYAIFEDRLSAGLLSTTTFSSVTTSELMLAATYSPLRWFDIALSGTTSTYGTYWGWAVNFCPRIINIFVGMDSMVTGITPQGVPYSSSNVNFKFGVNIPIGRLHEAN